jgi:hypothetical protein
MIKKPQGKLTKITFSLILYFIIIFSSLLFDFFAGRTFGAFMISVIPISLILLVLLFFGPYSNLERRPLFVRDYAVGATLILIITSLFCILGGEQAKVGEVVFTYSMLIACLPSSIFLPFLVELLHPYLDNFVFLRIACAWLLCLGLGWIQWKFLAWLYYRFRINPSDV